MNIIEAIFKAKDKKEILRIMDYSSQRPNHRYPDESLFLCFLSEYALNKEKNLNKPNFEGLELIDIFTHLISEIFEIKYELNQKKVDYKRVIDEIADCAGLLTGLIAYIVEHKNDEIKNYGIEKQF